jgi:hypothetical protein
MSHPTPPTTPAGWYPDHSNPAIQRYWDGTTWTDHTAPAAGAAQPAAGAAAAGGGFGSWWSTRTTGIKVLLIAGAVIVLLIVVSSVANAAAGGNRADRDEEPAAISAPTEDPEPSPEETPVEEATPEAPAVIDATYFTSQVNAHTEDYDKDLGDLIVTLDENGFWRLLTNSVELSFNAGQLEALEVPANIKAEYDAALATLAAQTTKIVDDISNETYDPLRGDIAAAQTMTAQLREIASRAVTG